MGLIKKDYIDGVTPTSAQNLNDIQDAIVTLEEQTGREANMALKKVNYIEGETPITAQNLNDIQDAVLGLEENVVSYEAGAEAFGLKGKGQGELIHLEHVHPIEHKVEVFVSDPTAKLKVRGKNLVNILMPYQVSSNGYEVLDNNSIRVYSNRGYTVGVKYNVKAPAGAKIVISFNSELGGEATGSYNLVHKNGGASIIANGATTIMPENGEMQIEFARTGGSGNNKLGWIDIKNLQVEIGTVPTEYEPYTETEYTANADGTVEGVKSISPTMNLSTDKAGAVIDAECFLDPQAVITDLTNTVITLGGEI